MYPQNFQELLAQVAQNLPQLRTQLAQFAHDFQNRTQSVQPNVVNPQVTVAEDDKAYTLTFRIPAGIEKTQLQISIVGEEVTLSDKGYADANTEGAKVLYDERPRLAERVVGLRKRVKDSGHTATLNEKNELVVVVLKASKDVTSIQID